MHFRVLIEVNILFPKELSNVPLFAALTRRCTRLLFIKSKNRINSGAKAIDIPPE